MELKNKTPLYGLILAGGKSTRMGTDKGAIEYHGIPQREFLYNLIKPYVDKSFLSIREDQLNLSPEIPKVVDNDRYKGPYNGILSAHSAYPGVAWLVLACDLPMVTERTIRDLIAAREPQRDATALATRSSGLPEPLAAIWEPAGLKRSVAFLEGGTISCPRKFLLRADVQLTFPLDDLELMNANSREEYLAAIEKIEK